MCVSGGLKKTLRLILRNVQRMKKPCGYTVWGERERNRAQYKSDKTFTSIQTSAFERPDFTFGDDRIAFPWKQACKILGLDMLAGLTLWFPQQRMLVTA